MSDELNARVWARHVSGEEDHTPWMREEAAEELAEDYAGQGVYRDVRLEVRP